MCLKHASDTETQAGVFHFFPLPWLKKGKVFHWIHFWKLSKIMAEMDVRPKLLWHVQCVGVNVPGILQLFQLCSLGLHASLSVATIWPRVMAADSGTLGSSPGKGRKSYLWRAVFLYCKNSNARGWEQTGRQNKISALNLQHSKLKFSSLHKLLIPFKPLHSGTECTYTNEKNWRFNLEFGQKIQTHVSI